MSSYGTLSIFHLSAEIVHAQKSVQDRAAAVSTFPQGIIARYKKPRPRLVVGKGESLLKFKLKDIKIYQRLHRCTFQRILHDFASSARDSIGQTLCLHQLGLGRATGPSSVESLAKQAPLCQVFTI